MDTKIKEYQVNGEMVWTGELYKVNGSRCDKPVHFCIRPLTIDDAEAMGNLSENIYENLRAGEECFIHKHSKEYFYNVFQERNIRYIGVFVGRHLIGMSYLKVCENEAELQEELPNSKYNFFEDGRNNNQTKVASFGADSVMPTYRGNSLNRLMINYRMNLASQMGCTDCTSIVDRHNRWNMTPYFQSWFNLFATAIDPSDGGKISLLHKPLANASVLSCFRQRITLPYERLEMIDKLLKNGFIGVEFDGKKAELTFAHSSYYVNNKSKNQTKEQPQLFFNVMVEQQKSHMM